MQPTILPKYEDYLWIVVVCCLSSPIFLENTLYPYHAQEIHGKTMAKVMDATFFRHWWCPSNGVFIGKQSAGKRKVF